MVNEMVSIHAPREGCDIVMATTQLSPRVSIHAPREGCDLPKHSYDQADPKFQFTHPGRGATEALYYLKQSLVSIHAPREGCDHS